MMLNVFNLIIKLEIENWNTLNLSISNNPSISPHYQIQVHLILETMPKSFSESL